MNDKAEKIIIALDVAGYEPAAKIIESLGDDGVFYKVGLELFIRDGARVLNFLKSADKKIFLDLKLHDIPNTVERATDALIGWGAELATIHAMGGREMMKSARAALDASPESKTRLLGVTVLTSINENILRDELCIQKSIPRLVVGLAENARQSGLHGVVASALELSLLREHFGDDFLIVTPGIRPAWTSVDDQKRVVTPREAFDRGASYIVIGRPIVAADSPPDAFRRICDEIG